MAAVGLLAAAFFAVRSNASRLAAWQIERSVGAALETQNLSDTRFEVVFCGTGSPQFQPDRRQPCLAILAAGRLFLFDAGQGAAQGLQAAEVPLLRLSHVFLTHLHSDHMSGLGDVLHNSWLYGRQSRVEVVGPPGTVRLLHGLHETFAADLAERHRTIGSEYSDATVGMGSARDVQVEGNQLVEVFDRDGIVISAFRVDHPNWDHAFGYKFEHRGRSIVISGDTRFSPNLVAHAKDADILIHEAVNVSMMQTIASALREHGGAVDPDRMALITKVHTPTGELARIAASAGAKRLVLTHLIPPIPASALAERAFVSGMADAYDGDITVARDGMRITLAE